MKVSAEKLNVNFVKIVEANPCIWDNKSKDYRNKKMVKLAWNKISKQINEPVDSLPERWRKIRDALFRSIKRHSIKKGNRPRKPYYLTSHLRFLLPLSKISTTCKNKTATDNKEALEYESAESKPGPFLDESNKTNQATESSRIDTELESISSMEICKKPDMKSNIQDRRNSEQYFKIMDEAESILSNQWKLSQEEEEIDSDMSFFKSLLRDVRKMNDRQNRKFRLRVLQVVEEIFDHISGGEESPERYPINS